MSERLAPKRFPRARVAIGLSLGALTAAGCGDYIDSQLAPAHADGATAAAIEAAAQVAVVEYVPENLERCNDAPLPDVGFTPIPIVDPPQRMQYASHDAYIAASDAWFAGMNAIDALYHPAPLVLPTAADGMVSGDPITMESSLEEHVNGAIVKVDTMSGSGSGFFTTTPAGERVVVTAAHVVAELDTNDMSVIDNEGNVADVVDGCYIIEEDGRFIELSQTTIANKIPDRDLAVLRIDETAGPIGHTTLSLAAQGPQRGAWVAYRNFQNDRNPGYPTMDEGMVVKTDALGGNPIALSGIQGWLGDTRLIGGASGGPAIDVETGEVVGVTTSSTKEEIFLDAENLQLRFDVSFPGAVFDPEKGFAPGEVELQRQDTTLAALAGFDRTA